MVQIAIVGTGMMGKVHASCFKAIKGCRIVACCDIDLKKSREFAREFNIPNYFASIDDLLNREKLDAVAIVTSNISHQELANKCLNLGIPVFCEKPLSHNYSSAKQMAELAEKLNILNVVNLIHRSSPSIQKAAQLIQNGSIGVIMHVEASYNQSWLSSDYSDDQEKIESLIWRLSPQHTGKDIITDFGPSLIDLVTFVAGDIASIKTNIRTFGKNLKSNKPQDFNLDSAVIGVNLKNGAIGTINLSRWATGDLNSLRLRVFGDQGGLTLDIENDTTILKLCNGKEKHQALWKNVKIAKAPSLWKSFIDAVAKGETSLQPSFRYAANIQKLLENTAP